MPQIAPRPTRPSSIIVPAVCPPYDINDAPLKLAALNSSSTRLPRDFQVQLPIQLKNGAVDEAMYKPHIFLLRAL